ncbi:MAG: hypothetical protein H0X51_03555 [Parachlamydiaceae bacterium]|nr:hypothetical protein [Parachlamydiaceae bacterium]
MMLRFYNSQAPSSPSESESSHLFSNWRVFGPICAVIVATMIAFVFIALTAFQRSLEEVAVNKNKMVVALQAEALQDYVNVRKHFLALFADQADFKKVFAEQKQNDLTEMLKKLIQEMELDRAFITDAAGTELVDFPHDPDVIGKNFSENDWYIGASTSKKTYISKIYRRDSMDKRYVVAMATPIRNDEQVIIGYLVVQQTISKLAAKILPQIQAVISEYVLLSDSTGQATANPLTPPQDAPISISGYPWFEQTKNQAHGSLVGLDPITNQESFISFHAVTGTDWILFLIETKAEAFAALNRLYYPFLGLATLATLAMLILAIRWAKRLQKQYEESKRNLDAQSHKMTQMSGVINQLHELTDIAAQKKEITSVHLEQTVKKVIQSLEPLPTQANAQIDISPLPTLYTDHKKIFKVFEHLIHNSIKFRKSDQPLFIKISGSHLDGTAEIRVEDNGIGFDSKLHEHKIFLPFQRLHPSQNLEGLGLGLSLCKKIITDLGGTIRAQSKPGEGAVFIIRLPHHHTSMENGQYL